MYTKKEYIAFLSDWLATSGGQSGPAGPLLLAPNTIRTTYLHLQPKLFQEKYEYISSSFFHFVAFLLAAVLPGHVHGF